MKFRFTFIATILPIYGFFPFVSFADDSRILLEPVEKYSFCTPYYGVIGHSLGVVGNDWALTFEIPGESFSGKFQTKKAYFYRGPNMHTFIGKPAGPRRPPIPETKIYSQIELAGVNVNIIRIKTYDKVMGPIEIVVDDFTVNSQQFHIPGKVNTVCIGPLP